MSLRIESLLNRRFGILNMQFLTLLCFIFWVALSSACSSRGEDTPEEYKYKLPAGALTGYSSDTLAIRAVVQKMLDSAINPFDAKWYDQRTVLRIDTLLYDQDMLRMIVLIIDRNVSNERPGFGGDSPFFYRGQYLYCSRDSIGFPIGVYNYSGYGFTSYSTYEEARDGLRSYCFYRRRREGTTACNVDDKRFWNLEFFESLQENYRAVTR